MRHLAVTFLSILILLSAQAALAAKGRTVTKKRVRVPKKFLELSLLQSNPADQTTTSLELSLSFARRAKNFYYMPYIGIFAVNLHGAYEDPKLQFGTSGLGIRLGAGVPFKIFKQRMSVMGYFSYAETVTQEHQWWGHPDENLKADILLTTSYSVKIYFKRFSIFMRNDFNSFDTYRQSHNIGVGYFF